MIKKLISTTDRLLEIKKLPKDSLNWTYSQLEKAFLQAEFVKQKLDVWMFAPCDEKGNILKEPYMVFADDNEECEDYIKLFCEAKQRVLFEGFKITDKGNFYFIEKDNSSLFFRALKNTTKATIEDILFFDPELTETAIKQIGY